MSREGITLSHRQNASVSTKLAVLKEQVLEDNLKRQRLLKRFADDPQP